MRLTGIEIYSGLEEVLSASLRVPGPTDRYLVKAIYGLDTDELVPKFYSYGLKNGDPFYRMGMRAREVVMRLVLSPNWENGETFSDLRDNLYRAIARNRRGLLTLYLKDGSSTVAQIEGRVTKFEVPHFNADPELQVTIECPDPYLRGITQVEILGDTFEDPPSGYISIPDNYSTAPHGMEMMVTLGTTLSDFTVQDDVDPDWTFVVTPETDFLPEDKLYIRSDHGKKELWMLRGSTKTSLMDKVSIDSVWPILFPGDNQFYLPRLLAWAAAIDYVRFYPHYWGV